MMPTAPPSDSQRSAHDPLAALIGEMSDGALIARSVDAVIVGVNHKLCDMFQVSVDALLGQDAGRFLPLSDFGNLSAVAVRREYKLTRGDGTHVRVDMSVTPLQNGEFMAILRESADRRSVRNGTM